MRRCASFWRARRELHQRYAAEIAEATALPVVALPYLPQGGGGVDELELLGDALLEAPA
jgi:anion-transporting  ArsA/GET3 family ATPase